MVSSSLVVYLDTEVETLEAEVAVWITSHKFIAFICGGCSRDHGGSERNDDGDGLHVAWVFGSPMGAFDVSGDGYGSGG